MTYIHELTDWPRFTWDKAKLSSQLAAVRHRQGKLLGRMEGLGFDLRNEAMLRTLTSDVVKSSEIEGETLDKDQVRSSIAKRLGLEIGGLIPSDRHVDGVVEMMLDACCSLVLIHRVAWFSAWGSGKGPLLAQICCTWFMALVMVATSSFSPAMRAGSS